MGIGYKLKYGIHVVVDEQNNHDRSILPHISVIRLDLDFPVLFLNPRKISTLHIPRVPPTKTSGNKKFQNDKQLVGRES